MQELVPRHEPKYEIILESEEKVTLVKEVDEAPDNDDKWVVPEQVDKELSVKKNNKKHNRRKDHENKTKKRRIGLAYSSVSDSFWQIPLLISFVAFVAY